MQEEDASTIEELKESRPLLVYYYVAGEDDFKNDNYKFSNKFETQLLGISKVVEMLNDKFTCTKVALSKEADMKQVKNQARIEMWSATKVKIGEITRDNWNQLDSSSFLRFSAARVAKSDQLVKKEIARIEKAIKERAEKDTVAKND